MNANDLNQNSSPSFYDLVEQFVDLVPNADSHSIELFLGSHANHADKLRELLPSLRILADFSDSGSLTSEDSPESPSSELGELGDFRILRELGRGGMGVVYEALQVSLNRRVALKILPFAGALDPRRRQRFQNEAMAAAQLRHPHIVGVHFVGCERGVHFYAMELIEGQTLAHYLAELRRSPALSSVRRTSIQSSDEQTTISYETESIARIRTEASTGNFAEYRRAAEWVRQIAVALDYAHSVGILHRDIKPSNILVDGAGHVWIADFGLAQFGSGETELTMTGDVVGTLRYASPEQVRGDRRPIDHRTDLYSLGITLYELLTHQPAFPANDRAELLEQVLKTEPRPPRHIDPHLPRDLETIVLKAIAKEPDERYPSLQALAEDLERFLAHEPIKARRASVKDRLAKWSRRHQSLVRLVGAFLVVLVLVASVASVLVIQAHKERRVEKLLARAAISEERQARRIQEALAEQGQANQRHHDYVSRIQFAWQAWNRSQFDEMKQHLSECRPQPGQSDLRSWEWRYLWTVSQERPQTIGKHVGPAYRIAFSPDESLLASSGADGVRIWNPGTGQQIHHLTGHDADVNWVTFSPDGRCIVTASDDKSVRIWEIQSGKVLRQISCDYLALAAAYFPDGRHFLVVERGTEAAQNRLTIYDVPDWIPIRRWQAHPKAIQSFDISADSKFVATASDDGCIVWDWSVPEDEPPIANQFPTTIGLTSSVFYPTTNQVVAGTRDGRLIQWDRVTGETKSLQAHAFAIEGLTVSRDGRYLVSASRAGSAKIWTAGEDGEFHPEPISVFKNPQGLWCACVNTPGSVFLADAEGSIRRSRLLKSAGAALRIMLPNWVNPNARFVGPGDQIVTGGHGVHVFDARTGQRVKQLLAPSEPQPNFEVIAVSPNEDWIAAKSANGLVHLWNAKTLELLNTFSTEILAIERPFGFSEWLNFTPESRSLIISHSNRSIWQLDCQTGQVTSLPPDLKWRFPASPDGRYRLRRQQVVDLTANQQVVFSLPEDLRTIDWSPDGRWLAGATGNGTLYLWETKTWYQTGRWHVAPLGASSVAFSANGRTIAVADGWGEILLWNVATQRQLMKLHFKTTHRGSVRLEFSANGQSLAATAVHRWKEHVWLWNASRGDTN